MVARHVLVVPAHLAHRCLDCGAWVEAEDADPRCGRCSDRHAAVAWLAKERAEQEYLDDCNEQEQFWEDFRNFYCCPLGLAILLGGRR